MWDLSYISKTLILSISSVPFSKSSLTFIAKGWQSVILCKALQNDMTWTIHWPTQCKSCSKLWFKQTFNFHQSKPILIPETGFESIFFKMANAFLLADAEWNSCLKTCGTWAIAFEKIGQYPFIYGRNCSALTVLTIAYVTWASCQIRKIASAHAPGMPGTFSPPPRVSDPDMHHGTCVTHVPWCMPGSLTSGFLWSRWRGVGSPSSCLSDRVISVL